MRLEIVLWPDPILLGGTKPIGTPDDEIRKIVAEMRRIMFELRGVGLAAPQVGIARRLMLVCPSGEPGDEVVVIDPQVTAHVGSEIDNEGCLSFPGIFGDVERARKIHVRYKDLDGRPCEMDLEGFIARVFQHEFDHLEGRVFIDRMLPESRAKIEDRLEEQRRGFAARAV